MPITQNLIEQVRRRVPKGTDYAVAKALELNQSHLAKVLCGKSGIGPKAILRISEILQRDLRDILVLIEEEQAVRPKDKEFWEKRSPRITATILTSILGVVAGLGVIGTDPANAGTTGNLSSGVVTDLYIMRMIRRAALLTLQWICERLTPQTAGEIL